MKRNLKFKKIKLSKFSKKDKRKKRYSKKAYLESKFFEIESPHNTNDYLVNNNSDNFLTDNNEDSIDIIPSSIIFLDNDPNEELNIFMNRENDSTKENTEIFKDKEQKGQEICEIQSIKF